MRKVLALDGGGIKGVFSAALLATVEDSVGEPIWEYFDLICGTSTGGIIALGLGPGIPATEILRLYLENADSIFPRRRFWQRPLALIRPKYDPTPLQSSLQHHLGDRRLGESRTRLVIPALNLETCEIHLYKTSHHPKLERDFKLSAVEVALSTASAPTYYPAFRSASGLPLLDGGVWANNPAAVAAVEAVGRLLNWPKEDVRMLSLGCTTSVTNFGGRSGTGQGMAYWARHLDDLFLSAQSSAAMGTAYSLFGHERVTRISPIVPSGRFALDNAGQIESLRGLGESEARKALPALRRQFFDTKAEPFAPCHTLPVSP